MINLIRVFHNSSVISIELNESIYIFIDECGDNK